VFADPARLGEPALLAPELALTRRDAAVAYTPATDRWCARRPHLAGREEWLARVSVGDGASGRPMRRCARSHGLLRLLGRHGTER